MGFWGPTGGVGDLPLLMWFWGPRVVKLPNFRGGTMRDLFL